MNIPENSNNDEKELHNQQEKDEIIELAVQAKNVRRTTLILVGAIAVAFAAIWLIHKKAAPAQTNAAVADQQLQIEAAIAQLTGLKAENVGQVDQLVKKFYEFADFGQVAAQQLRRNPFNPSQPVSDAADDSSKLKENNSNIQNDAQKMQLKSIMQSKYGNCCMIDDTLLYKGDKINGFEIVEISTDFVKLTAQGRVTILRLETE
ncbi:MAG: hypothetical protein NTW93_01325 [Phycisphaerae bacterium]|nr:hypothetical protein [Phycisphaerae bacterium]